MADSSLTSTLTSSSSSSNILYCRKHICSISSPSISSLRFFTKSRSIRYQSRSNPGFPFKAQSLDFSSSFFEGGFGSDNDSTSPSGPGLTAVEDKEEPQCPPGLRKYETMAVLRPDVSEDERLALTQKYEEASFLSLQKKVAFCSERSMTFSSPTGDQLVKTSYKVLIPIGKIKAVQESQQRSTLR